MRILKLHIQRFRGFSDCVIEPKGHAVVMGVPGGGRSDVVEALSRVLDAEASRNRWTTELDFNKRDTSLPVQIEITLAALGSELEQHFIDHLELWDQTAETLIPEGDEPETIDGQNLVWVLRLEYRAEWVPDEERCEDYVHYPKHAQAGTSTVSRVPRRDIDRLGFGVLRWAGGRILDLTGRSAFRRVVERAEGEDFATATQAYLDSVAQAAGQFTASKQIGEALKAVVNPLRKLLRIDDDADLNDMFSFAPEGGSASGLLRSLGPSMELDDGAGSLPAWRHGSTIASLFRMAEALAVFSGAGILAIDDLGEGVDAASAVHFASILRKSCGQAWITTRIPSVAEVFDPKEVVRLGRGPGAERTVHQGKQPSTKADIVASKHWHRSLLPALNYEAVVVVEGPNDFAALHSLALRLAEEQGNTLPAGRGTMIINAGSGGSGGYPGVLKLASAARAMGLRAVGVVDGDTGPDAVKYLKDNHAMADAVIRLPDKTFIEMAVVSGISDAVLRQALKDAASSAGLAPPADLDTQSGVKLADLVVHFVKSNGLHGALIDALPASDLPQVAINLLETAITTACGDSSGVTQL